MSEPHSIESDLTFYADHMRPKTGWEIGAQKLFRQAAEECASLRAALAAVTSALETITRACEVDCCNADTERNCSDDEGIGLADSPSGETELTFGMIRRARAALVPLPVAPDQRKPIDENRPENAISPPSGKNG